MGNPVYIAFDFLSWCSVLWKLPQKVKPLLFLSPEFNGCVLPLITKISTQSVWHSTDDPVYRGDHQPGTLSVCVVSDLQTSQSTPPVRIQDHQPRLRLVLSPRFSTISYLLARFLNLYLIVCLCPSGQWSWGSHFKS